MIDRILDFLNTNMAPLAAIAAVVAKIATAVVGVLLLRLRKARARIRQAEDRSAELARELERNREMERRFISLLTHELRTPLGAITGYQELIADGMFGKLDQRGMEALSRIRASGDQLSSLLDGIAELISPGSMLEMQVEPTDLQQVLDRSVSNAQSLALSRGVTLNTSVPAGLPMIDTDPQRLAHALDLAFGAAVRASVGNGTALMLRVREDVDGLHEIVLENSSLDPIRDDPRLALSGQNGAPDITTGAGLRLAMAYRLIHSLKGDVELQPSGAHTTLQIRLWAPAVH